MPVTVSCIQCGSELQVIPARARTFKFCSNQCRGAWRSANWTGKNHPNWQSGPREKACEFCGGAYTQRPTEAISTFKARKFCSKKCADIGGFRYSGEHHPSYRKDARVRNRNKSRWADKVIQRDNATCQRCGARGVELHAHHIKSFRDYPELRNDVDNGLTLCFMCHAAVHAANDENGVNSGKLLAGKAEDNPEPSRGGNGPEGATTRGRAYRRWVGECAQCGSTISRRLSDTKDRKHMFCDKQCAGKFRSAQNRTERICQTCGARFVRVKSRKDRHCSPSCATKARVHGGNSSTSAPRESDDIV